MTFTNSKSNPKHIISNGLVILYLMILLATQAISTITQLSSLTGDVIMEEDLMEEDIMEEVNIDGIEMEEIRRGKLKIDQIKIDANEMDEMNINANKKDEIKMVEVEIDERDGSLPLVEYAGIELVENVKMKPHLVFFRLKSCDICPGLEASLSSLSSILNMNRTDEIIIAKVVCVKETKRLCGKFDLKSFPILALYDKKKEAVKTYEGIEVVMLVNGMLRVYSTEQTSPPSNIVDSILKWELKEEDDGSEVEVVVKAGVNELASSNFHRFISYGQHLVMLYVGEASTLQKYDEVLREHAKETSAFLSFSKLNCSKHTKLCTQYQLKTSRNHNLQDKAERDNDNVDIGDDNKDVVSENRNDKRDEEEEGDDDELTDLNRNPEFLLFENGSLKDRFRGEVSHASLEAFLTKNSHHSIMANTQLTEDSFHRMAKASGSLVRFHNGKNGQADRKGWVYVLERVFKSNKEMKFGEIDCRAHEVLCQNQRLMNLPSIKLYRRGKVIDTYKGNHSSLSELFDFSDNIPSKLAHIHTPSPPHHHHPGENTKVLHLSDRNFRRVSEENEFLFVKFVTTRCLECKSMVGAWERLAEEMWKRVEVVVGEVHCDNYLELCRTFEITEYPSVLLVHRSKRHSLYLQSYDFHSMHTYLLETVRKIRHGRKNAHLREDL